jgi:ribosomal protein L29
MSKVLSELSDQELCHSLLNTERELVVARFQHSMGLLENTSQLSVMRKTIARRRGELRRREIARDFSKGSLLSTHRKGWKPGSTDAQPATPDKSGGFLSGIVDKLSGTH